MTDADLIENGAWYFYPLPAYGPIVTSTCLGRILDRSLRTVQPRGERILSVIDLDGTQTQDVYLLFQFAEDKEAFGNEFTKYDPESPHLIPQFEDRIKSMKEGSMLPVTFIRTKINPEPFGEEMNLLWNWILDKCCGDVWTTDKGLMFEKPEDATLFQLANFEKGQTAINVIKRRWRTGPQRVCGCGFGIEPSRVKKSLTQCASCARKSGALKK